MLALATACTPAERKAAGIGMVGLGLTATTVGVELDDPCVFSSRPKPSMYDPPPYPGVRPPDKCRDTPTAQQHGAAPQVALPLSLAGLGVALVGGIVYLTGLSNSQKASQHGAAAAPFETPEEWSTPHPGDPDF